MNFKNLKITNKNQRSKNILLYLSLLKLSLLETRSDFRQASFLPPCVGETSQVRELLCFLSTQPLQKLFGATTLQ